MIEKVSTFKERFNQALSIRNIKPVELFEKTGISESTISQYRSGYAQPKEDKLLLISNALDVNPVWLLGLNVHMDNELYENSLSPAANPDNVICTYEEKEIVLAYRRSDSLTKAMVLRALGLDLQEKGDVG